MNNLKSGTELPMGFSMALSKNSAAMNAFTKLSGREQQQIVDRAFSAGSKKEMQSLVGSLTSGNGPAAGKE